MVRRSLEGPGCGVGGGHHPNPHGRNTPVMTICMPFGGCFVLGSRVPSFCRMALTFSDLSLTLNIHLQSAISAKHCASPRDLESSAFEDLIG